MIKPVYITVSLFNRLSFSKRCIKSILDHTDKEKYELTIIDDCSTDGTQEWLRELKKDNPEINIYLFKEWVPGVARCLNFSMSKKDKSQFWVSMDNDIVHIQDNWLDKMLDIYKKDDAVGIVAVKSPWNDSIGDVYPIDDILPIEITTCIPNKCTMLSPDLLNDIGGYCDDYSWTGFDYDITARAVKLGYKAGYYCTSVTNPKDYIDVIDLGIDPIELEKIPKYEDHIYKWMKEADKYSNKLLLNRSYHILLGSIDLYSVSEMRNFRNYEEL